MSIQSSHLDDGPEPRQGTLPVRLSGGDIITLRPLGGGEAGPLLAVFDGMSAASRAQRYLTGMTRLSSTMLDALTDVDGQRHVAWLASAHGRPIGIARFVQEDAGVGELAVEVVDDYHGMGVASALVDAVTTVAAARGVRRVRASLSTDNEASRRLMTRVGIHLHHVDGLLEGEGPLHLMKPSRVDRNAVLARALLNGNGGATSSRDFPA